MPRWPRPLDPLEPAQTNAFALLALRWHPCAQLELASGRSRIGSNRLKTSGAQNLTLHGACSTTVENPLCTNSICRTLRMSLVFWSIGSLEIYRLCPEHPTANKSASLQVRNVLGHTSNEEFPVRDMPTMETCAHFVGQDTKH